MIFKGTLTTLRPLSVDDAGLTLRWRQGHRARYLQRGAETLAQQADWICAQLASGDLNFIIEYANIPVGMIALQSLNQHHKSAVLGRLLIGEAETVASAPVAFEAELMLCDYLFFELKFHKLYGDIMADNLAMIKTRMYLGYSRDGVLRDHYNYDGVFKNTVAVSLLEDEYRAVTRPKLLSLIQLFAKAI